MSVKLHIKKGDMVYVIAGDSRGQQGKVLAVDPEKQRAIVEGVNMCREGREAQCEESAGRNRRERSSHPYL